MPEAKLIASARPAVALDGRDEPVLSESLTGLAVAEDSAGLYRCEAVFGNWGGKGKELDYLYFDRRKFDFGKALRVSAQDVTLFEGRITALEGRYHDHGPRELAVLAEDRFQDLRMTRRTRTFADVTDSEVFSRVAGDHGLTPQVSVQGPRHKVLSQTNQSDLAFLRERARAVDAEIWMDGSTLHASTRAGRDAGTRKLTYGGDLFEFSVLADLAHQRTSVFVNGWDVGGKRGLQHEATDAVISGELGRDASGASILSAAFGARKEALAHTVPLTEQEAQAHAESFFRMTARRFVVGRGTCATAAGLRVGGRVELSGLGPLFNGRYYLSEVRHAFDFARGLRTTFTAERPGLGRAD
jgi:phage protein D